MSIDSARVTALIDHGASPLLGYALACSVAWHTQRPVLLIATGTTRELDVLNDRLQAVQPGKPRAYLRLIDGAAGAAPSDVFPLIERSASGHPHILVQLPAGGARIAAGHTVHLAGPSGSIDSAGSYVIRSPLAGSLLRPTRLGELHVPGPIREDESGLVRGVLAPTTPMGRALGWTARDIAGLKVGVALGAGSALGYAHIGVLRTLRAIGVPIDYLAGASVGSSIAALCAAEYDDEVMAQVLDEVGQSIWRPTLPRAGLLSVKMVRDHLRRRSGDRRIEDLPIPLGIVATDIEGQREIVFRRGLVWPALLASIAIPGIFPPQRIGPYVLVDGGVVNPVPADVVAGMGADVVIAVKLLGRPRTGREEAESSEPHGSAPTVAHTLARAIELMQSRITAAAADAATIQITVDCSREAPPRLRHFTQGRRFIPLGEAAAEATRPRLTEALPWLTRMAQANSRS